MGGDEENNGIGGGKEQWKQDLRESNRQKEMVYDMPLIPVLS